MEIILLRHGKPVNPDNHNISASSFYDWVKSYNEAGLCSTSKPTQEAINIAKKCKAIVCSELPRSIELSEALNVKIITLSSSKFNEAGLPSADWYRLKLSPKIWAMFFRVLWLLGYSKNSESYKQAINRALESKDILIDIAKKHKCVLFVGHGVYNRLIAKELKACGWAGPKNPSSEYWSHSVYEYKKT